MNKWDMYKLPKDMKGESFLDVGCWEGDNCVEAIRRNAVYSVGIDLCTSESLKKNVEKYGFEFLQLDIFSEKFLELGRFDVVLCSGVLYHVENVLSLLFRLRKTVDRLLVLETAINKVNDAVPILLFHPGGDLKNNPSNWWTPNKKCLISMLETCGFKDIHEVYHRRVDDRIDRLCVHAVPGGYIDHEKIMPRKKELMSLSGGERRSSDEKPSAG